MYAMASSPSNGVYGVTVYYTIQGTPKQDHTKPSFFIPAIDLDHAIRIAYAITEGGMPC